MFAGYSLEEAKKAAVQLVSAGVLLAGFFLVFDPSLGDSLIAFVVAIFGVIAVFGAKNATEDDWQKAVQSLTASVLGVVTVFETVDPSDAEKWLSIAALIVPPIFVYATRNKPVVIEDPVVDEALAHRRLR